MNEPYDRSSLPAGGGAPLPSQPYSALADSAWGRLIGALVSPGATFRSIAERPTWALALLVLLVVSTLATFEVIQHTDYNSMFEKQLAKAGQPVTPERLETLRKITVISTPIGVVVISIIACLLMALVFWLVFKAVGGETRFPVSLAVSVHALLPGVVAALLGLVVILSHSGLYNADDAKRMQSQGLLASNLGAVLPDTAGPIVKSLASSVDVFALWTLVLLVIGYRAATKVSRNAAIGVVVGLWLVYLLVVKVGFAALAANLQGAG